LFNTVLLRLLDEARLDELEFVEDLDAGEREAAGTPDRWSARDHVAHLAYWRQRFANRLEAALRDEPPSELEPWETMNAKVFEEHRHRPWPDVLAAAERSHRALGACIERLTDEDLVTFGRFDWVDDGQPLHDAVMGSAYEHLQVHLAQYHIERGNVPEARRIHERSVARVVEADTPPALKGLVLYNLACFLALRDELEQAAAALERALALYPTSYLVEFARTDPDLAALRDRVG
jgi:hypothetical protein